MAITLCSTTAAFAQEDELIMTFKSDAYAQNGENNVVSILLGATEAGQYVDIDYGYGKEELELEVAQVDSEGNWSGSFFSCSLNAEGIIKVYGDPTKINLVNASGCFLTEADLSKMTNHSRPQPQRVEEARPEGTDQTQCPLPQRQQFCRRAIGRGQR